MTLTKRDRGENRSKTALPGIVPCIRLDLESQGLDGVQIDGCLCRISGNEGRRGFAPGTRGQIPDGIPLSFNLDVYGAATKGSALFPDNRAW